MWHVVRGLPRPLLAASCAGWLLLAGQETVLSVPALCLSAATASEAATIRIEVALAAIQPSALVLAWLAMILAMMAPLLASPLLHVWRRSLARRRVRALALFLFGYAIVWLAAGAMLTTASLVLGSLAQAVATPPLVLAALVASIWQATPLKQASLNHCHRQPSLAAFGLRADADAFFYGGRSGVWCVGTCWAAMLLPLAATGLPHWPIMAGVTLMLVLERARAPAAPEWGAAWPRPRLSRFAPMPART